MAFNNGYRRVETRLQWMSGAVVIVILSLKRSLLEFPSLVFKDFSCGCDPRCWPELHTHGITLRYPEEQTCGAQEQEEETEADCDSEPCQPRAEVQGLEFLHSGLGAFSR